MGRGRAVKVSPDKRQHRGAHPADKELFDASRIPPLGQAVSELSWLLTRQYAIKSALKLVGDRHSLSERQRLALARAACSDQQLQKRKSSCLAIGDIRDQPLMIDGFNTLITIEAALSGGLLIRGRDGCIRDLSSVHGSYRSVLETEKAIALIGEALRLNQPASVTWLLDRPVSNSGRLAQRLREMADLHAWAWSVDVVINPDTVMLASEDIAVTADSIILDGAARWVNFNQYLIEKFLPHTWIVDLRI